MKLFVSWASHITEIYTNSKFGSSAICNMGPMICWCFLWMLSGLIMGLTDDRGGPLVCVLIGGCANKYWGTDIMDNRLNIKAEREVPLITEKLSSYRVWNPDSDWDLIWVIIPSYSYMPDILKGWHQEHVLDYDNIFIKHVFAGSNKDQSALVMINSWHLNDILFSIPVMALSLILVSTNYITQRYSFSVEPGTNLYISNPIVTFLHRPAFLHFCQGRGCPISHHMQL